MASDKQHNALQVIFSFFLGLMLVAFIGVGVNTFYPSPYQDGNDSINDLYRQQGDIESSRNQAGDLSAADQRKLDEIRAEIDAAEEERQTSEETWARNTSIILILFATLVMGVSLVRMEQLQIISNGLLLGGLFTMVYGVGWVIAGGSSVARFAVMSFALLVTFALGYARFVRVREARGIVPATAGRDALGVDDEAVASLDARVAALERRAAAAARALGRDEDAELAELSPHQPRGDPPHDDADEHVERSPRTGTLERGRQKRAP